MAILVSDQEMFFTPFQPKAKNLYIMSIDGIPSFIIKKTARPTVEFAEQEYYNVNVRRKYAGKPNWSDINIETYDPIIPSAAQAWMTWIRTQHESITGRSGYADFYKKDLTIDVLGPPGDKVEQWILKGAFLKSVNFGELTWEDEGAHIPIAVTLKTDFCILNY